MVMQIFGTHPHMNEALQRLVAPVGELHAAAVYVIDPNNKFGAPVSSFNRYATAEDTHRYTEIFHRTRLSGKRSAAVRYGLHPKHDIPYSRQFEDHHLRHDILIPERMILQSVAKGNTPPPSDDESDDFKTLRDIADNITQYQRTQGLGWSEIFGLRPDRTEYDILCADVNGFSKLSNKEQVHTEAVMIRAAQGFKKSHNMEVFHVIGDEVRLRRPASRNSVIAEDIIRDVFATFTERLKTGSKLSDLTVRAAASRGYLSDIFIDDPNALQASIAFNGSVLTHIANTMKKMDRTQKLVFC